MKAQIIECTEQGRFCLKKFIPTRPNQGTTCVKCLDMLGVLDDYPLPKQKTNIWK